MTSNQFPRRKFLAGSLAVVAVGASGRRVLGANGRISLAFIGCGGRGSYLMQEAVKHAADMIRIAAVCDVWRPNRERAVATAEKYLGERPKAFARYADVLSMKEVDAVVIATPDFAHSPILRDAARAGKDAYCEKPMGTNTRDLREAVRAVEENRRIVAVGTQRRSETRHQKAVELIRSGILGNITYAHSAWNDHAPRWNRPYDDVKPEDVDWKQYLMGLPGRPFDARRYRCWHLFKDYTIGVAGLLGAHGIDMACWYMNDFTPLSATAHGGTLIWKDGREHADTMECLFQYSKGWLLNYSTHLGNDRKVPELVLYGSRGSYDTDSWTASGAGGGSEKLKDSVVVPASEEKAHTRNWLECVRDRKAPNATVRDGLAHSIASIMAHRALDTGRRQVYDPAAIEVREG